MMLLRDMCEFDESDPMYDVADLHAVAAELADGYLARMPALGWSRSEVELREDAAAARRLAGVGPRARGAVEAQDCDEAFSGGRVRGGE